ncbi:alpha-L-glutamate ligase-like protein [Halorhodospira abdelmalekii]|uniref:alpha-L-glutamate ligase-like protein n=1 Tax=Halorhodospira abdelmalekii TaxID=421629 RepID=UPI0019065363|nr:alpha-L-glutamate ligase-like protein [Halorhodospira abdelmalekii]MBK1735929.1 alpha-L-glutamate ligase-like protein [Halorhodospira abdelmalekii]
MSTEGAESAEPDRQRSPLPGPPTPVTASRSWYAAGRALWQQLWSHHWLEARRLRTAGVLGMNQRNIDYIGRYNERRLYPGVDDKLRTKLLAREYGVSTPQLHGVIRQQHEVRRLEQRIDGLNEFVIKPAKGSGGKGILVISERRNGALISAGGRRMSMDDLRRHVSNTLAGLHSLAGAPDVAIIEERICLDPLFERLSCEGVPDIRVIVFLGYPVMAMLRLATRASSGKANLHQGAIGVGLDLGSGQCAYAVQNDRRVYHHPDTGSELDQVVIPDWRDLLVLAARCQEMSGLGYLGADLVIDRQHGPQLLELNARPGLSVQIANGAGLLPRLRLIESLQRRHESAAERVDFAMHAFGTPPGAALSPSPHAAEAGSTPAGGVR